MDYLSSDKNSSTKSIRQKILRIRPEWQELLMIKIKLRLI